jgi:CubicO group peptidase (beta-lactamase class C family)
MNSVTALLPCWLKRDAHHSPSRPGAALLAEMREWVAQEKLIGGVGMIVRDGRTVFLEAVGLQDRERAIRAQPDTIFALTSATKPITCAGAMTLVDNGLLSLDDPIHRFIPAVRQQRLWNGSAPSSPILIRHIMTHCSGLIDAIPESFLATDYSLKELVAMGSVQPLAFDPGSRWAYANLGVNVLGRIIEIVSDRPFDEFIHRSILEPLGMKNSFYTLPRSREHRIAAAYASAAGVFVREELPFSSGHPFVAPSSSLFSTAQDLARFLQMLLGKGSFAGRRILSPHSAEAMVTSQTGSW